VQVSSAGKVTENEGGGVVSLSAWVTSVKLVEIGD
jgi:hypothetical protein